MYEIIRTDSGFSLAKNETGIFELIELSDFIKKDSLLIKILFLKGSEERYRLKFDDEIRIFFKSPLFTKFITRKYTIFDHNGKQPAAYIIMDYIENKFYIGSSSNVSQRLHGHKTIMSRGTHFHKHLNESYKRNGTSGFQAIVIYAETREDAYDLEQKLLDIYWNDIRLLNTGRNARLPSLGKATTSEALLNMSKAQKMKWTDERKEHMREIMKERIKKPGYLEKISNAQKAYFQKPGSREKMSELHLRRFAVPGAKEKQSDTIKAYFQKPGSREKHIKAIIHRTIPIIINGIIYNGYNDAGRDLNLNPVIVRNNVNSNREIYRDWNKLDQNQITIKKETISDDEYNLNKHQKRVQKFSDPAVRKKMSDALKNKYSTEESREIMRQARIKQSKPVSIDGTVYRSAEEAGRQLGLTGTKVLYRVNSQNDQYKNWIFATI